MEGDPLKPSQARKLIASILTCDQCGGELGPARRDTVPYPCGLPNVRVTNVLVSRCGTCDNYAVDIPHVAALHRCLANAVAMRPGRLTGPEVKFLRKFLGLSGRDMAERFFVEPETISRWETGVRAIAGPAEGLLRVLALSEQPVKDYRGLDLLKSLREDVAPPAWKAALTRGSNWKVAAAEPATC